MVNLILILWSLIRCNAKHLHLNIINIRNPVFCQLLPGKSQTMQFEHLQ